MKQGAGNQLTDAGGVRWIDMLSGILNCSLGHGSSVVSEALREVANSGLVNSYDRTTLNAQALMSLLGEYDNRYTWKLLNTGAEAVERAVQLWAAVIGARPVVAVLKDSFHGKSITMSGIRYDVPWGNPFDVLTIDPDGDVPYFNMLFFEPVKGWNGERPDEEKLLALCNERSAILVADEMITGFGRCGQRFMSKHADMIISGKGLAQGVPLAVLGARHAISPAKFAIGWNTTCGGNNLSATVGLHVLRHLMQHEGELRNKAEWIEDRLVSMGFSATGALGFKTMKRPQSEMRPVFEQNRVIASWHDPFLRVGPSFATVKRDMDQLEDVLKLAEMR
jgi:acetylornithine/succinyldiaminopimelate/putrescine aminotransferase